MRYSNQILTSRTRHKPHGISGDVNDIAPAFPSTQGPSPSLSESKRLGTGYMVASVDAEVDEE
jgi:hypothetical protein